MSTEPIMDPNAEDEQAPSLNGHAAAEDVDNPDQDTPETDNQPDPSPAIDAAGVLRHADYTRKTQELARERESLRAEAERLGYLKEFEQILAENPELQATVQQTLQGARRPDNATTRELMQMRQEISQFRQDTFINALDATASKVAKSLGMTSAEIVAVIKDEWDDGALTWDTPVANLEKRITKAAKAAGYDKARQNGASDLANQLREKAKAATPKAKSAPVEKAPEVDTTKMTTDERVAYMLKMANKARS